MSPKAELFLAITDRIATAAPAIRFTDQDWGQLENYGSGRPPVSWPCTLIDITDFQYTDVGGQNRQSAIGFVQLRMAQIQWSPSNNLTQTLVRQKALEYYENEQEIHKALQGWAPTGFSRLLRRSTQLEQRDDDIRVLVMRYAISFDDSTTQPTYTSVPRPNMAPAIEKE